ncbi:hypothetical protein PCASD_15747 [Puccinia coronata f. sp. avenae]|uniref:Uncharacterized protein n=1 Tax=Puccinia coronata f. sp. avenae TaxID=200324 RepID=A0A2N5U772_9BASI|nr:hypothetical protein PCASD_22148 [Puccinia coronata f. sp. avenae]PLW33594.1 hypothetical protein PCASD_15747 [Puccinia coronata f. sp. avenae]
MATLCQRRLGVLAATARRNLWVRKHKLLSLLLVSCLKERAPRGAKTKAHSPRGSNPQSLDPDRQTQVEIEVQRVTITPGERVFQASNVGSRYRAAPTDRPKSFQVCRWISKNLCNLEGLIRKSDHVMNALVGRSVRRVDLVHRVSNELLSSSDQQKESAHWFLDNN